MRRFQHGDNVVTALRYRTHAVIGKTRIFSIKRCFVRRTKQRLIEEISKPWWIACTIVIRTVLLRGRAYDVSLFSRLWFSISACGSVSGPIEVTNFESMPETARSDAGKGNGFRQETGDKRQAIGDPDRASLVSSRDVISARLYQPICHVGEE